MNTETHRQLANDIWSICNLLRGPYKRNEYRKVILPLTVLRRFDCLLAPTKAKALESATAKLHEAAEAVLAEIDRLALVCAGAALAADAPKPRAAALQAPEAPPQPAG
jgi:type I restriction-modification system DNA methylase subunit